MIASSIWAKLSAIGFWHQLHHHGNPCDHFLVKKAILGVSNLSVQAPRYRLPVSPSLLLRILHVFPSVGLSSIQVTLFTAVFTLAFFAFLQSVQLCDIVYCCLILPFFQMHCACSFGRLSILHTKSLMCCCLALRHLCVPSLQFISMCNYGLILLALCSLVMIIYH